MSTEILERFKKLDAYAKTLEDFRIKTISGATITILGALTMIFLFIAELNAYMSPNITEELFVDTSRSPRLRINLDIIVPQISCNYIVLDAMDTSGEQHLHIDDNIYKKRLTLMGEPIDEGNKVQFSTTTKKPKEEVSNNTDLELTKCGSCYGAAFKDTQCCNTCDEVREAYKARRWAMPDLTTVEQCKDDPEAEAFNNALKEGCQIYGHMEVNRVGGSFHLAPGKSFTLNHVHIHDVQPYTSSSFNTSHKISHLSFGNKIETGETSPLDGINAVANDPATMFQYYIKIVPTIYVKLDGTILHTNQFSVTRHQKAVSIHSGESGMPGIFFSYELSPLMVKYTEKSRSFGHFATSICAIVGGVFTVAGILDTLLYHSLNALSKKLELGKAS